MSNELQAVVKAIKDSGINLDRGTYVRDWPDDEKHVYRGVSAMAHTERLEVVAEYRRVKLAEAILEALRTHQAVSAGASAEVWTEEWPVGLDMGSEGEKDR